MKDLANVQFPEVKWNYTLSNPQHVYTSTDEGKQNLAQF